jgi:riboflavin synthase
MFTGLVESMGRVASISPTASGQGRRLWIAAPAMHDGFRVGDSVAVNGCCLTVTALAADRFAVEAVPETLARTTIGALTAGQFVNLERPLRVDQRLGGHMVQGHVDGVGEVVAVATEGDGRRVTLEIPAALARFVAEKGSLAVDGTSLTVAAVEGRRCEVALIPHTLDVTVSGHYQRGTRVNLEVDLIARYLARLLEGSSA